MIMLSRYLSRNIPGCGLIALSVLMAVSVLVAANGAAQDGPYRTPRQEGKGPLKVFIFGGQSNMQGQGTVTAKDAAGAERKGTLVSLLQDKAKAPMLKHLIDAKGEWVERDDVWVYDVNEGGTTKGPLQTGYGWEPWNRNVFGPELQAGHVLGNYYSNQVLIIKTAWGGKSLQTDFRPPSSGGKVGPYYTDMVAIINRVLSDIKREFPAYDGSGYEIVGLAWWHGFNDGCCEKGGIDDYEKNLTNFINDLRKDLKSPQLPIFITEFTGTPSSLHENNWMSIRKAQAATAARPEFRGTAQFIETHDFVREEKDSPGGGSHHEWNNAETYFLVGNAIGETLVKYMQESTTALSGPGPYVKLASLATQIQQGQGLGGALKTLTTKKSSKDPIEAAEATTMLAALTKGAQEQLDDAINEIQKDPVVAITRLNNVATRFSGSEFATKAKLEADTVKKDPKIQKEIKAGAMLEQIVAAEATMKPFQNVRDPKAGGFRTLNAPTIQAVLSQCQALAKRYPGTNAAKKAEDIIERYR
jgi:hypothetical protein